MRHSIKTHLAEQLISMSTFPQLTPEFETTYNTICELLELLGIPSWLNSDNPNASLERFNLDLFIYSPSQMGKLGFGYWNH